MQGQVRSAAGATVARRGGTVPQRYDAVVIGGGHNGLVSAAYLARAGLRTLVLERRHVLGGAAVTEEVFPGFRFSVASYVVSLLRPEIIRDLELPRHGLRILPLDGTLTPLDDDYLWRTDDHAQTMREIRRWSAQDAEAYSEYGLLMVEMARFIKPILGITPLDPRRPDPRDAMPLGGLLRDFGKLPRRQQTAFVQLMTMSAADFLDQWFETAPLKATMSASGIIGTYQGVRSPGTAYVLLHHYMGEIDGAFRAWGIPRGGTGGVSEAIASAARSFGAEIRTEAPVARITVRDGRATGVVLESGEEIGASAVLASHRRQGHLPGPAGAGHAGARVRGVHPPVPLPGLVGQGQPGARRPARLHVPARARASTCGAPSASRPRSTTWSRHTTTPRPGASAGGRTWTWSSRPSSTRAWRRPASTSSAASCSTRRTSSRRGPGTTSGRPSATPSWTRIAERAPNIRSLILHRQVLTPLDIERTMGLTEGNIFQGELSLEQLFVNRPAPGWARFRTPGQGPLAVRLVGASGRRHHGRARAHRGPGAAAREARGGARDARTLRRPGTPSSSGGGHNGLVCGTYLARGGLRTLILERREAVGGALATAEIVPGARVPVYAHTVGRLRGSIARDLGLSADGLRLVQPAARVTSLRADGPPITLWGDPRGRPASWPLSPAAMRRRGSASTPRSGRCRACCRG